MKLIIAIGSDHRGFEIKELLKNNYQIENIQVEWKDVGCFSAERCDYPPFAQQVSQLILKKEADFGVLLCGSGIGMAIAANRLKHIYAGLVWHELSARLARSDDNINIVSLPTDFIDYAQALKLIGVCLTTQFKGGRYAERLNMLDQ